MLYEVTTLSCRLLDLAAASECARTWVSDAGAKGLLLGCWRTDIGTLGRVFVLRAFENGEDLSIERRRALINASPFNAGSVLTDVRMESFAPFPFLPRVEPAAFGEIYEFRSYWLKPGGIAPTLSGWEKAIGPAGDYTQHLVVAMYALDGATRIMHIWGFESLKQRSLLRANAYASGVWPPQGGPQQIVHATSTIGIPQEFSPLC